MIQLIGIRIIIDEVNNVNFLRFEGNARLKKEGEHDGFSFSIVNLIDFYVKLNFIIDVV